jgi:hypothetical protein
MHHRQTCGCTGARVSGLVPRYPDRPGDMRFIAAMAQPLMAQKPVGTDVTASIAPRHHIDSTGQLLNKSPGRRHRAHVSPQETPCSEASPHVNHSGGSRVCLRL